MDSELAALLLLTPLLVGLSSGTVSWDRRRESKEKALLTGGAAELEATVCGVRVWAGVDRGTVLPTWGLAK